MLLAYKLELSKQNVGSGHTFGIQIIYLVLLRKMQDIFNQFAEKNAEKDTKQNCICPIHHPTVPLALSVTSVVREPSCLMLSYYPFSAYISIQ